MRKRKRKSKLLTERQKNNNALTQEPKKRKKRMSRKKKRMYLIIGFFVALLLFSGITFAKNKLAEIRENNLRAQTGQIIKKNAEKKSVDEYGNEKKSNVKFQVHIINVGQGQSILIKQGDNEVLIDGGNKDHGQTVSDYISSYVDGPLEYVINTSYQDAYSGGLATIYSNYKVKHTIYSMKPGKGSDDTQFYDFYKIAKKKSGDIEEGNSQNIDMGKGITLVPYKGKDAKTLLCVLTYGNGQKAVITGAADSKEMQYLNNLEGGSCSFLVLPQLGSPFASPKSVLKNLGPGNLIISSADADHGGPSKDTVKSFAEFSSTIYTTYNSGTIVLKFTNGSMQTDAKTVQING